MPWVAELDDRRWDVRRGATGIIRLWPKVDGLNVAVTSPTSEAFTPAGISLGALSVTNDTVSTVSRLSVTYNATAADRGEAYRVDFTYTYSGATYVESTPFDVVVEPWGTTNASMSDIVDEWAGAALVLANQARLQASGRTDEQQAQIILHHANRDIRSRVKARVEQERGIGSWPIYVSNRDELRPVVIAEAVRRVVVSQGMTDDSQIQLESYWAKEVERRWAAMPALKYSADDDRVPESSLLLGVCRSERRW